jgi:hypothetical protein
MGARCHHSINLLYKSHLKEFVWFIHD